MSPMSFIDGTRYRCKGFQLVGCRLWSRSGGQSRKQATNHLILPPHLIPRPLVPALTPSSYVIDHRWQWLIAGRYSRHVAFIITYDVHMCILVYV